MHIHRHCLLFFYVTLATTLFGSTDVTRPPHPLEPPKQETPAQLGSWQRPDSRLRYDQTCFLTAHNAFANIDDGWYWHPMQNWSIKHQLNHGIRGLMLDVYDYNNQIVLCHGSCSWSPMQQSLASAFKFAWANITSLIITPRKDEDYGQHKRLKETLLEIVEWLNNNPQEIVTLFFENYVQLEKLDKYIKSIKDKNNKYFFSQLFTRELWEPHKHKGNWPTLEWLIKANKRLIIFVEDKSSSSIPKNFFGFPQWEYIIESYYGTLNYDQICEERDGSRAYHKTKRTLYLLNLFSSSGAYWQQKLSAATLVPEPQDPHRMAAAISAGLDYKKQMKSVELTNTRPNIQKLIHHCRAKGMADQRNPNFIALDFVDQGTAMQVVNLLNYQ